MKQYISLNYFSGREDEVHNWILLGPCTKEEAEAWFHKCGFHIDSVTSKELHASRWERENVRGLKAIFREIDPKEVAQLHVADLPDRI